MGSYIGGLAPRPCGVLCAKVEEEVAELPDAALQGPSCISPLPKWDPELKTRWRHDSHFAEFETFGVKLC